MTNLNLKCDITIMTPLFVEYICDVYIKMKLMKRLLEQVYYLSYAGILKQSVLHYSTVQYSTVQYSTVQYSYRIDIKQ